MKSFLNGLALCLVLSYTSYSQKIENVDIKLNGPKVSLTFDLGEYEYGKDYEIYLYGSQNNFVAPLKFVTGDVGRQVKGDGLVKSIHWDARTELGPYTGKISLEVRVKPYTPFLQFKNLSDGKTFKRGKNYLIEWGGSEDVKTIDVALLKDKEVLQDYKNIQNREAFTWDVPRQLKPGKDYQIKISNSTNQLDWTDSEAFRIKRKVPTAIKVAPLFLVAAVYCIVTDCFSTKEEAIPRPPKPE